MKKNMLSAGRGHAGQVSGPGAAGLVCAAGVGMVTAVAISVLIVKLFPPALIVMFSEKATVVFFHLAAIVGTVFMCIGFSALEERYMSHVEENMRRAEEMEIDYASTPQVGDAITEGTR